MNRSSITLMPLTTNHHLTAPESWWSPPHPWFSFLLQHWSLSFFISSSPKMGKYFLSRLGKKQKRWILWQEKSYEKTYRQFWALMANNFRLKNSINILMIFDQIGGSFELAEQVGEIFFFYWFGYLPKFKYSSFYCLLMVIELVQK